MRRGLPVVLLLLAGCAATTGGWTRPGADAAAVSSDLEECRAAAGAAVRPSADIDQDIRATRQSDAQRSGVVRRETEVMREQTKDRAAALVAACMRAKGYAAPR